MTFDNTIQFIQTIYSVTWLFNEETYGYSLPESNAHPQSHIDLNFNIVIRTLSRHLQLYLWIR